jgi:orotate phosphoribosyltransferase
MDNKKILDIFRETGVMKEGHFVLTSGRHAARYMQCAALFCYPDKSELLCVELAKPFMDKHIDLVIGPAVGGIIIAYEMARQLGVPGIFAERENGMMTLRRGFEIPKGANVLVVEDVITTGGSVREVIDLVHQAGANLAGVGVIVDRSAGKVDFGVPLNSVLSMEIQSFEADECPLCKQGLPYSKPGSRGLIK